MLLTAQSISSSVLAKFIAPYTWEDTELATITGLEVSVFRISLRTNVTVIEFHSSILSILPIIVNAQGSVE